MPKVLGYGEDALTYSAITQRCGELLELLGDETDAEQALCIYRPSFGRRASDQTSSEHPKRAEFGEFDAIVATSKAIYLIESKWHGASVMQAGTITLRDAQARRHKVFERYLQMRRGKSHMTWSDFVAQHGSEFNDASGSTCIAAGPSRLALNLQFLLDKLTPLSTRTVHVLLYFEQESANKPTAFQVVPTDPPVDFKTITMTYYPLGGGGIFYL